uniref:Protein WFDC11 n=2 Tax=Castor canadensis TaxID=51338 RepID=A0A8B7UWW5_CASCN|nr:protein WFDC11 [Castor canadensis]
MRPWSPLCMMLLCVVLLSVLGEMKTRYNRGKMLIEECWLDPNAEDCTKKCSKTFRCFLQNHTCCWAYCGDICLENKKTYNAEVSFGSQPWTVKKGKKQEEKSV